MRYFAYNSLHCEMTHITANLLAVGRTNEAVRKVTEQWKKDKLFP
ncbi:hypothetical protein BBR47_26560 [Brevibacillus brevis NBRC 100599]|uniref:Uncharacterized protein n=1 Tax=Brevibacillus brevis (strain 47 / JCM 6285 / NBRC 100599) TaxID=358681 RepID=C0ZCX4_BREBN|nr:hypothetical protein BBR47_26560 [Brevibacillus brevis NBRC 100599]